MEEEKFVINLQFCGYKIPLEILKKDEIIYRDAIKYLNKRYDEYANIYQRDSKEELFVKLLVQLSVIVHKQIFVADTDYVAQRILALEKEIDIL